ncbi:hypothetical protein [Bacillus sp. 03113]|uniref:hypothetical protein n=1 Tax=Bacillus sp. 03113 TaxID=2578211 RepID=UPI0015E8987E|nr:hypothetical protein [Bacillus sp. 03113]
MFENTPNEVNQIEQKAKEKDDSNKKAKNIVDDAISHMSTQRHYNRAKSQNKR